MGPIDRVDRPMVIVNGNVLFTISASDEIVHTGISGETIASTKIHFHYSSPEKLDRLVPPYELIYSIKLPKLS